MDISRYAARLDLILRDLGYEHDDGRLRLQQAAEVIRRHSGRPFEAGDLKRLLRPNWTWRLEEAVTVAVGLGVDLREIAFAEGEIPKSGRRSASPLDDLGVI